MQFQVEIIQKMSAIIEIYAPNEETALRKVNEMISKDAIPLDSFYMEEADAVVKHADNILIFPDPTNRRMERNF